MYAAAPRAYRAGFIRRYLVFALMVVFGYLGEVCIMPYIRIFGISPNLLYVMIGIITVAFGKLRVFWVGMIYGLLMQIMLPSVAFLNLETGEYTALLDLALYSLSTLFCSFAFADKPLKTLEYERAVNRRRKELAPWLRTVLCTALNTFIYEAVHVTYIYLGGSPVTAGHIFRALLTVLLTSLLCLLLLFPLRRAIFGPVQETAQMKTAPVMFTRV